MGIPSTWQCLAGLKHANGDPWIQPDQRLLSRAPISKMDNTSKSQLPMTKILPSEPQDEQSVSLEFFEDGNIDDLEPQFNVEQPYQELRLNPRWDSQPQDSTTPQEASIQAGTSVQGHTRSMT